MKYILILSVFLTINLLAASNGLYMDFKSAVETSLKSVWFFTKIIGFVIIMWSLKDLISNKQGADDNGKLISIFIKLLVASIIIGAENLYLSIMS